MYLEYKDISEEIFRESNARLGKVMLEIVNHCSKIGKNWDTDAIKEGRLVIERSYNGDGNEYESVQHKYYCILCNSRLIQVYR